MKKEKNNIITIIVLLLILFGIIIALLIFYPIKNPDNSQNQSCDYGSNDKIYLKKDPNCVVNFLCTKGKTAFSDECGCGCKLLDDKPVNNFCTNKSRTSLVCYDLYQPVCGWFNQNIKCIKYPCAQTFSNSCFACMNKNVEFWTEGDCPK